MARSFGVLVTALFALGSAGCSFLFADPPPQNHQKMLYFDCTSTPGLEVADGLFGLSMALTGAQVAGQSEREFKEMNEDGNQTATATTFFVAAGVFAGSAIYGIVVTENCGDAKANLRQRIIERERKRSAPPVATPPSTTAVPVGPTEPIPPGAPVETAPPAAPAPTEPAPPVPPAPAQPPAPPTTSPPPKPGAPSF